MEEEQTLVRDPVCGAEVAPEACDNRARDMGKTYYFCSLACQLSFQEAPERYREPYA